MPRRKEKGRGLTPLDYRRLEQELAQIHAAVEERNAIVVRTRDRRKERRSAA